MKWNKRHFVCNIKLRAGGIMTVLPAFSRTNKTCDSYEHVNMCGGCDFWGNILRGFKGPLTLILICY